MFTKSNIIWEKENKKNTWVCFRKKVNLENVPKEAITNIAVDSKYWLYINDKLVVLDGGLNRESKTGCGYYDQIDISKYLNKGSNIIAVLVWYWGNQGRNNVDSHHGGLLFESKELNIFSDDSWKVKRHSGFIETKPPYPSYLYGGYNIGFDAAKDIGNWIEIKYSDDNWQKAYIKNKEVWGKLYKRPIPQFYFSKLQDYKKVEYNNNKITAYLPYACHLTPYFKVKAKQGQVIDIRTDRYTVNGGPGDEHHSYNSHRTEYITNEGIQEFESLDWLFGEKVIYTIPEDIEVLELKFRESGYDTSFDGYFKCENNDINKLVDKCQRTLYICMRDNYMDCPDRERGQWIGDVSAQIPQTFYCLNRKVDYLSKKAISDFINLKKGDVLLGNVPGVNSTELPAQSLNAVSDMGMILSYYIYSGDRSVIEFSYQAVKNYLMLWNMEADGLITSRKGNWYWFDHLDGQDNKILENCWYYMALKSAVRMAKLTNNPDDIKLYAKRMDLIKNNINKLYKRDDGYKSIDSPDDRANAMVLLSGIAQDDMITTCIKVLEDNYKCTPYMEYYVLEAMIKAGYPLKAVKRMMERYEPLIHNENTTLWEDFNILGTKNHAWTGGPLTIFYKYGAGIYPLDPGYKRAAIMPMYMNIDEIQCAVPLNNKTIEVEISYMTNKVLMKIKLPENMPGRAGIPKNYIANPNVTLNDLKTSYKKSKTHYILDIEGECIIEATT